MGGPTVTFLGGIGEIGGSKLVVQDGPDRLLFDFGPSFSPRWEEFYLNFLQPRSTSPVKDLLEFDLLPRVDGLYSAQALAGSDLRPTEPQVSAIFVSHAHFDHAGHLGLVDPRIPVYASPTTRRILEAVQTTTPSARYGEHPWNDAVEGTAIRIGAVEVEPFAVDHSIPGALGFLIHTSAGAVVYTGDFRAHGPRAPASRLFLERARSARPLALVIEGTRAGPDPRPEASEAKVRAGVDRVLQASGRLALTSYYPRDVDRISTMYRAARAAGREFVVSMKTAYLLTELARSHTAPVGAPLPGSSEGLRVYARSKRRYYTWEQPLLDEAVDADWVGAHGPQLLLSLDLAHFAELIDLRPTPGSPFIHSMSEPFSEDDLDHEVLRHWLEHFGLQYVQLHASGHCSGPELLEIAREVGARRTFPIHTEHPEHFREIPGVVDPVRLREPYRLGAGR